jgi:photosystem II stability/assembly factor-like uncharacterized protein
MKTNFKKTLFALTGVLLAASPVLAQQNFYDVRDSIYVQEYEGEPLTKKGYKQFSRWENFMIPRVYPSGEHFDPQILWKESRSYRNRELSHLTKSTANWQELGPTHVPINGGSAGRVNIIAVDPTNSSNVWVGTPNGGLWQSTDAGLNWTSNTDLLPNMGVSDFAINPQNTTEMYIATGDGFGTQTGADLWGGTYSNGVMKSTDGGANWSNTGLNWNLQTVNQVYRLIIDPLNPQILIATSSDGIWRTTDGAANWTQVQSTGNFRDIEFKPGNSDTIYANGDIGLYRSTDNGVNWQIMNSPIVPAGSETIAVTADNPSAIFYYNNGEVYKSPNDGVTWNLITDLNPLNGLITGYGWYTACFGVSPHDEGIIYCGGVELGWTTDGGANWSFSDYMGQWPFASDPHADHRIVAFDPVDPNTVYVGNDGGIYKTQNHGTTWQELGDDLTIAQFYRLGGDPNNEFIVYAGAQDQGVYQLNGAAAIPWRCMDILGDGMECLVDHTNANNVYACTQYGQLYKSTNAGVSFSNINSPGFGNWLSPLEMDPFDNLTLFMGLDDVYKTVDGGSNWQPMGAPLSGQNVSNISICEANTDYIYITTSSKFSAASPKLYQTSDGGSVWNDVSSGLPTSGVYLTAVEVSSNDPLRAWATFSGFAVGDKVYATTDGGNNWTNISGTLPNVPANCIVYEDNAENGVYLGMDFGVFYRNDTMSDWIPFMTGLPNSIVMELEMHKNTGRIRAATYGRGLWESQTYELINSVDDHLDNVEISLFPNPTTGLLNITAEEIKADQVSVVIYNTIGQEVYTETIRNLNSGQANIDLSSLKNGQYFVRLLAEEKIVNTELITVVK